MSVPEELAHPGRTDEDEKDGKPGIVERLNGVILGTIAGRGAGYFVPSEKHGKPERWVTIDDDPGEWYGWSRTPNQQPLRMIAGYAWNMAQHKELAAFRFRDEFVEYGRNQRENGFMSAPISHNSEGWNATEQLTSTHWWQWATAYYGALWLGIKYGDAILRSEAEWFIACELYWFDKCDPLVNGERTGRVIVACARAKGTETPNKKKPFLVENTGRNQAWKIANGMKRKKRTRLDFGTDCANLLELCVAKGWKFPEMPILEPLTMAKLKVWVKEAPEGMIVETQIVDGDDHRPMLVEDKAVEHTRYNLATGAVEMIR